MTRVAALAAAASLIAACTGARAPVASGPEVVIEVGALAVEVTRVIYAVTLVNRHGEQVLAITIDSDDYAVGDDPAVVRFGASCVPSQSPHTVTVSVVSAWIGTPEAPVPLHPSALPPPQTHIGLNCNNSESNPVVFTFQFIGQAGQGFFDMVLGASAVFCSAKLDCTDNQDGAASFFPASSEAGLVLGFVCRVAADTEPVLHLDDLVIDCGAAGGAAVSPAQAGNLPDGRVADPGDLVDRATVFRGEQALDAGERQLFWNVAVGLNTAALEASCTLTTRGTVTDGDGVPVGAPWVAWDVPLTAGSAGAPALACGSHAIFGGDGVGPAWPVQGVTPVFDHAYQGVPLAFVTSTTYRPGVDFASVADADALCQAHADGAELPGEFFAWLGTSLVAPADRVGVEALRRVDGEAVASGRFELLGGALLASVSVDEAGASQAGPVWTGAGADGTATATTCADWTSASAATQGTAGDAAATDVAWTAAGPLACDQPARLYCVRHAPAPSPRYGTLAHPDGAGGWASITFDAGTGLNNEGFIFTNTNVGDDAAPSWLTLGARAWRYYHSVNGLPRFRHDGRTFRADAGESLFACPTPPGSCADDGPRWSFHWSITVDAEPPTVADDLWWSLRIEGPGGNWGTLAVGMVNAGEPGGAQQSWQLGFDYFGLSSAQTPDVGTPGLWDGLAFDPEADADYAFVIEVRAGQYGPVVASIAMDVEARAAD